MKKKLSYEEMPLDKWDTRDIAMWAATAISKHEQTCAKRWGVLVKLMWGCLGGIGLILVAQINNLIPHLVPILKPLGGP